MIMEEKREKKNFKTKVKELFKNRNKRYIVLVILLVPVLCFMAFFGVTIYKEAKQLMSLASEEPTQEIENLYVIEEYNYVLRDTATELQIELFEQLRSDLNNPDTKEGTLAEDVCKNYVADFYTWTNKISQYDVGGLYFLYNSKGFKKATYLQARDGIYKYLSTYIDKYGAQNLLEVSSVNASAKKIEDEEYGTYFEVKCDWMYKPTTSFSTTKYEKSKTFAVINNEGRYEIVGAY